CFSVLYCRVTPCTSSSGVALIALPRTLPSPLAGEGYSVVQQCMKGEGDSSQEARVAKRPPHPFFGVAAPTSPLPQGERAKTAATFSIVSVDLTSSVQYCAGGLPCLFRISVASRKAAISAL